MEEYRAFNAQKFGVVDIQKMSTTDVIHHVIDSIVEFEGEHVGFDTIFSQSASLSDQLAQATTELHGEVIQQVSGMMRLRLPGVSDQHILWYASVVVMMVKNIKLLTSPPNNLPKEPTIKEIKRAILAYLRDIMIRENMPLPDDLA